jgi:hypothetical protein
MMRWNHDGSLDELTASGVLHFDRRQAVELIGLLDHVRAHGGGPHILNQWLNASTKPRACAPIIKAEMRRRGVEPHCVLCASGVDGTRYTRAKLRRLHGVDAAKFELVAHRRHMRRLGQRR